ncbi:MAG TPA: hypothetical protein VHO06_07795 [Polyangia bacterium]|nr:hypothetical protein [Polyangia bacterium]
MLFALNGPLTLADRVTVQGTTAGTFGAVGDAGTVAVALGTNTQTGNVWSVPSVSLASNAKVNGFVRTGGALTLGSGASVTDSAHSQSGVAPDLSAITNRLNFTIDFPSTTSGDVNVNSGTRVLAPGNYGAINVASGATLSLSAGVYTCNSFDINTGATLVTNVSGGTLTVLVKGAIILNGAQTLTGGSASALRFATNGTTAAQLNAAFAGIVVAPFAAIQLDLTVAYTGAYFGVSVVTQPGQTYTLAAWDGQLPPPVRFLTSRLLADTEVPARSSRARSTKGKAKTSAPKLGKATQTGDTFDVTIQLTAGLEVSDVVLFCDGGALGIGAAQVQGQQGRGAIVNVSASPTTVGPNATTGDVVSIGDVTLAAGTHVRGGVDTAGTVTADATAVQDQPPHEHDTLPLTDALSFSVTFPPPNQGDHTVAGPTPLTLTPDSYGNVSVMAGGTLILKGTAAGSAFSFVTLTVAAGGTLQIDTGGGVMSVNVLTTLQLAGGQSFIWGDPSALTLVYVGTAPTTLTQAFAGTLFAPRATLTLAPPTTGGVYTGSFFASALTVADGTTVIGLAAGSPAVNLYFYGFAGEVGAGTYDRDPLDQDAATNQPVSGGGVLTLPLGAGLDHLTIEDNRTYRLALDRPTPVSGALTLQSGGGLRPYLLLESASGGAANLAPAAVDASFAIDGLWIGSLDGTVGDFVVEGIAGTGAGAFDWDAVVIQSATLDPGGTRADGLPIAPMRLFVTGRIKTLTIKQSIVAPIIVDLTSLDAGGFIETLIVEDSIIDATQTPADADGRQAAVFNPAGAVQITRSTVFGDVHADLLQVTDSIVVGAAVVANTQASCIRFSAVSLNDPPVAAGDPPARLPRLYRVPALDKVPSFFFTSMRFGDAGYAQLSQAAPAAVSAGAENGSEMGAFSTELRPIQLAAIVAKVDQFKPVAVLPQYVLEEESAIVTVSVSGAAT